MRKECELCGEEAARMYCESDQASLCWECDAKVHAANFLVARHTRTLLCHRCHSPTPWSASGPNLGPTLSVCHLCVAARPSLRPGGRRGKDVRVEEDAAGSDGDREDVIVEEDDFDDEEEEEEVEEEDDDEEEEDVDSEDDEKGEGDNQVVPWSASPPPAATSSTTEESFPPYSSDTSNNNKVRSPPPSKRMRDDDDGGWHMEVSRSLQPAGTGVGDVEATSSIVSHRHKRPLFVRRPIPSMAMQSEAGQARGRSHGRDDIVHLVSVAAAGDSGDRRL